MGMQIRIPYQPRSWARELHASKKRWNVLVLHRRAGKTTACIHHLMRDALRRPDTKYAYIAPTFRQAKRIAWDMLRNASIIIPGVRLNETELTVTYPNKSKIFLVGAENPDSLRGIGLDGCAFDEYSQQPSNIFSEIISKALGDRLGYAIWLGTPKGKNEFYRIFQESANNGDWMSIFRTIEDSLKMEKGATIQNLRVALEDDRKLVNQGLMTVDEFKQEWYCSFEASIKGAYYEEEIRRMREEDRFGKFPYDPSTLVHTVWDLGIGKSLAIGFYQRFPGRVQMIDYWEGGTNDALPQAVKRLQSKEYVYGKHFAPHDIEVHDFSTGKTRLEVAKGLGIRFEALPKLSVDEGINAGRQLFPRLFVNKSCALWLDAISQYRREWDEDKGIFKPKPLHDWTSHAADVHKYASFAEKAMESRKQQYVQTIEARSKYEGDAEEQKSSVLKGVDISKW